MKEFWNTVSDDDCSITKQSSGAHTNNGPFSRRELLKVNLKNKKERYVSLVEDKNNGPESRCLLQDDMVGQDVEHKRKCEKGNTKEQLSFWEGILEEKADEDDKALNQNVFVLKDNTSTLQDKQSFWNDVSEDKMWENKKQRKLESHIEYNIRPQQQRVDLMVEEWRDNIKPFSRTIERVNDKKKLRENIRLKTTGIKVDLMAKLWEGISEDQADAAKILEGQENTNTGYLSKLQIEDEVKESILRKRQLWNEAVLKGRRKTMSDISPSVLNEMSDVELLCQAIHICGEDHLTQDNSFLKSITFQKLAQVFPREELAGALADGHKYKVVEYCGDVQDFEADTRIILKIPIEEIVEAFTKMKSRNPNIYRSAGEKNRLVDKREIDSESDSE